MVNPDSDIITITEACTKCRDNFINVDRVLRYGSEVEDIERHNLISGGTIFIQYPVLPEWKEPKIRLIKP